MRNNKVLYSQDEWDFVRTTGIIGSYTYIRHSGCNPENVTNLHIHGRGVHWARHRCMGCDKKPPEELLGMYILDNWDDIRRRNNEL